VHEEFAEGLKKLTQKAGCDAPLFIVAHSLGTVIASNYLYDLQYIPEKTPDTIKTKIGHSPLERGETLTSFYSFGSPLALWSLRYADFDQPITVPSPLLVQHYPSLHGE
jgi:hypothetical protein